jgi:histidinol-phosphate/aromatic aminotransferase/cobyric acid decarboxylase-like protein/adenosyl cobinamide kinase/adenosyl cobinamide phosphate guanylyltransferase
MGLTLVLGATRSGKSAHAETLARASGQPVRYLATADPDDGSMVARIAAHVLRRPPEWETVVAGDDLAAMLRKDHCVLLDGLGTWIAGVMFRGGDVRARIAGLVQALTATRATVIVVAEQAGAGLLPPDPLSRDWLDLLGEATQALAAAAERAVVVVAGRAIELPPPASAADGGEHGGDLRHHGDTLVRPGDADHAVNVLAGGPPPWLCDALQAALAGGDLAAYPREDEALAALATLHGRLPEEIVPCNGAAQALWLLPAALRPRLAACVHPAFTETEAALRAHGVPVQRVLTDPDDGFALRPADIPDAADLVVVGNPASPSGGVVSAATLLALRRPGRTIVVDEAFMDMVPGEPDSLVREAHEGVIVVRSLTKSLAIPGLRAGYAVACPPLAVRLRAVRPPWSCNALALAALTALARRPEALTQNAVRAQAERTDLEARLAGIPGLRAWPAAANYVLVRVAGYGPVVTAHLREKGIVIRPASSFPGLTADDLRLTARGPEANARLARALAEAVAR